MSHYEAYLLAVTYYLLKTRIKRLSESETEAEEPHAHTHTLYYYYFQILFTKRACPQLAKALTRQAMPE